MTSVAQNYHALTSQGGVWDPRYSAGDKVPNLAWTGVPTLTNLPVGTPVSVDVRALLTDDDPGNTTITFETRSGDSSNVWGDPGLGNNLTHTGSPAASGVGFLRAARTGGIIVDNIDQAWSLVSAAASIKWNPGHYVMIPANAVQPTYPSINTWIAEIAAMSPKPEGISIHIFWGECEPTKNNYTFTTAGTAYGSPTLASIFQTCKDNGLRLMVTVMNYRNGNHPEQVAPPYLASEPNSHGGWTYFPSGNYVRLRLDAASVMDRFIAFINALGAYFDSEAKFEGIQLLLDGIVYSGGLPADYLGHSVWSTQYQRLPPAGKTAFPTSNIYLAGDWGFNPPSFYATHLAVMEQNRCGEAGSDMVSTNTLPWSPPTGLSWGQSTYVGLQYNGSAWVSGGIDYRGRIPASIEHSALGCIYSAADLYTHMYTNLSHHHMRWYANQAQRSGYTTLYWDNSKSYALTPRQSVDIKTWLQTQAATHPAVATAPSCYTGLTLVTGG